MPPTHPPSTHTYLPACLLPFYLPHHANVRLARTMTLTLTSRACCCTCTSAGASGPTASVSTGLLSMWKTRPMAGQRGTSG
eukprot:scaffold11736_cov37-Phaeocystis_antarctica.AAC.1